MAKLGPMTAKRKLSVVDRRLASGAIFNAASRPIPLTEPDRWTIRLVNSQISETRLYDMQAEKGWVYLEPGDLAVKPEEVGLKVLDGRVVRGERGAEVVMKMEKTDYAAVQKLKDQTNRQMTFSPKATKDAIVAAGGHQVGDQAATFLQGAVNSVTVTDSVERVSLEE